MGLLLNAIGILACLAGAKGVACESEAVSPISPVVKVRSASTFNPLTSGNPFKIVERK